MPHCSTMVRSLLLALSLGVCTLVSWAQSPPTGMSYEETVVRTTYAKLSYATKIGTIHRALTDERRHPSGTSSKPHLLTRIALDDRMAQDGVLFQLSNFSVGLISDLKRNYAELVTKPDGSDVLSITTGGMTFTEDGKETFGVTANGAGWSPGQNLTSEDWNHPAAELLPQSEHGNWFSRYAAFTVTVQFQGKSRTYNAMFLFGVDDKGLGVISAIDTVLSGAVNYFVNRPVYPATLLKTSLRAKPVVADWLKSHQVFDATCKPGKEDVCCDLTTLECGVAAQDVNSSLSQPVSEPLTELVPPAPLPGGGRVTLASFPARRALPRPPEPLDCSIYNSSSWPGVPHVPTPGTEGHVNLLGLVIGHHHFDSTQYGLCNYVKTGPTTCRATAQSLADHVTMSDDGATYGMLFGLCHHTRGHAYDAAASGGSPTAHGVVGGAVKSCLLCNCDFTMTLGVGPVGSISFSSDAFWDHQFPYDFSCSQISPIVIDTTGHGYHLTSAENGVVFDIRGDGLPIQTAWTDGTAGDAFLALDRNGNGIIDSGKELFGDVTDQPVSASPNGFLALAEFDKPENGGNGDGIIDARDKIWPSLRLWIDSNHDGISQPGELYKLDDKGIHSLDLKYKQSQRKDEFGNLFRYKGTINPEGEDDGVQRVIWDVFLLEQLTPR
jgi:hypothetical protein